MRIVIIGAGKVGAMLAQQLSADHSVTIVDTNVNRIEELINIYDVRGICGNGAGYEIQRQAEVERAALLIATTSSDEINILACLVAKKLGVQRTIARVRNPEYERQLRFMRQELGLSMAINPEKATAREIARMLRFPAAAKLEAFAKGRLEMVEYRLTEKSVLNGMHLLELYKSSSARVLICAVVRNDEVTIPSGEFKLEAGDRIHITASPDQMARFFKYLGEFRSRANAVVIVGASKICYYLASELLSMGVHVKIVDRDEQRCRQISEKLPRAMVIIGDGTDVDLLQEEGAGYMDAFVAITGMDEANILMSMCAAELCDNCKIITKINRQPLVKLVDEKQMIDSVVSPSTVTAEVIVGYIRAMENATGTRIKTMYQLVGGAVEALEFLVPADFSMLGVPLKDMPLKSGILIAGIVRRTGQIVIPGGNDVLEAGDDVILVTKQADLQDLDEIFR